VLNFTPYVGSATNFIILTVVTLVSESAIEMCATSAFASALPSRESALSYRRPSGVAHRFD
jgi:hypothetical protein